jgi:antitoxin MazE
MWEDPIVAEVRRAREEYGARFDHDLDAIFRDLKEQERISGDTFVTFPPRRIGRTNEQEGMTMKTRVKKTADSLTISIPLAVAEKGGLVADGEVDVTVAEGQVVVRPTVRKWTLDELLEGITEENLHGEIDFGPPVGREVW